MIYQRQWMLCAIGLLAFSWGQARDVKLLDTGWRFIRQDAAQAAMPELDDSSWEAVAIPHTWNAVDGQTGKGYYRGPAWYRLRIALPERTGGQRVFVHFGAACIVSDVYCNGRHVGNHRGGVSAFCHELTRFVEWGKENLLAVRVTNEWAADIPPLEGDFNMFGGIYRPVHLITAGPVCITPLDYGATGVYLKQVKVDETAATVEVTTKVSNIHYAAREATVKVTVSDHEGKTIAAGETTAGIESPQSAIAQTVTVDKPHLWNGVKDPYLYHVRAELWIDGKLADTVEQPLGLRYFRFDPNEGFYLNGKSYSLHGVNKHQDTEGKGWAMSRKDMETDMAIMQELGATCVRMAHYQHADYMYELCDKAGLMVWTEIPLVNYTINSEGFANNAKQQLIELIRQNYNHPSVLCWGLYNELVQGGGDRDRENPNGLIEALNTIAHQEDPTRPTTAASNDSSRHYPGQRDIADLTAWNLYPGWYVETPGFMGTMLDRCNEKGYFKGLGVSEYGAGASILHHEQGMTKRPRANGQWHPEEWQAIVHEKNYAEMRKRPYVWGTFIWVMFDFASDGRTEGDRPGINDKGLVTCDRKVKKDAFYYYQAAWRDIPVLRITSSRHTPRDIQITPVKVYTNLEEVELKVNGVSIGSQKPDNFTCLWKDVKLKEGANQIEVSGLRNKIPCKDSCTWDYQPGKTAETKN